MIPPKRKRQNDKAATQAQIIEFVRAFWAEHHYGPTIREVTEGCHLSSTSVAVYYIDELARAGILAKARNRARTLRVV